MKVGDGDKANRAEDKDRHRDQRREKSKGEKTRSFSEVMERRTTKERYNRGDERGRKLKEGTVQRQGREAQQRCVQRREMGSPAATSDNAKGAVEQRAKQSQSSDLANSMEPTSTQAGSADGETARELGGLAPDNNQEIRQVRESIGAASGANYAESAQQSEPTMTEVARQIVNAVRVGEDGQARRVVFLDVTVPGQGDVRIRLRREGANMEVRMRADNDALARTLQQGIGQLRREGAKREIQFSSIQVVR